MDWNYALFSVNVKLLSFFTRKLVTNGRKLDNGNMSELFQAVYETHRNSDASRKRYVTQPSFTNQHNFLGDIGGAKEVALLWLDHRICKRK